MIRVRDLLKARKSASLKPRRKNPQPPKPALMKSAKSVESATPKRRNYRTGSVWYNCYYFMCLL